MTTADKISEGCNTEAEFSGLLDGNSDLEHLDKVQWMRDMLLQDEEEQGEFTDFPGLQTFLNMFMQFRAKAMIFNKSQKCKLSNVFFYFLLLSASGAEKLRFY